MTAEEHLNEENNVKPFEKSCFKDTEGIIYHYGEIDNINIFSEDQMIAFAKHHHKEASKELVEALKVILDFDCINSIVKTDEQYINAKKALENHLK